MYDRGSIPGMDREFFAASSRPALGPTQPHIQWVPGRSFPAVKRPGREAADSPPSSAGIRMRGPIPPLRHTSS
jgi:hypothetical protein